MNNEALCSILECQNGISRKFDASMNTQKYWTKQEPMSRSMQLPYKAYVTAFLQTDLFLVHLKFFFFGRKAVPVQWLSDVN